MFAGPFDVLHRMDQVAVRNHGMMSGFFKFTGAVILRRTTLVLGSMVEQLRRFQVMVDALL